MNRTLAAGLTIAAILWAALLVSVPFALVTHRAATPASIVYAACSRICHQRPARSFRVDGKQMPVCARCTGLYMSGACGAALAWIGRRRRQSSPRRVLIVAALPTAVVYVLEHAGGMEVSNGMRAAAALPLGGAAAWLFVRMLQTSELQTSDFTSNF